MLKNEHIKRCYDYAFYTYTDTDTIIYIYTDTVVDLSLATRTIKEVESGRSRSYAFESEKFAIGKSYYRNPSF